jgi:hypothetical protein
MWGYDFWISSHFQALHPNLSRYHMSFKLILFEISSHVQEINERSFRNSGLRTVVIPASVRVLGEACFQSCQALDCVTFKTESMLERIEKESFHQTSLQSVVLPGTVTFLGYGCFLAITPLCSLAFESRSILKQTGEYSFDGIGLEKLTLPSSIEIIRSNSFVLCRSLKSLEFESGSKLQRIEHDAFAWTLLMEVQLPNSVCSISGRAFDPNVLRSISFCPCPTAFCVRGEMVENASGESLILYRGSAVSYNIPKSVETIGDCCFRRTMTLELLTFEADSGSGDGKLKGSIVLPRTVRGLSVSHRQTPKHDDRRRGVCRWETERLNCASTECQSPLREMLLFVQIT